MAIVSTHVTGKHEHEFLEGYRGVIKNTIDFSENGATAGDVIELLKVGAGMHVSKVFMKIDTKEGASATADIGDGDDPNGFGDAENLNANNGTITHNLEADPYAEGKYYAADDTIDLTLDDTMDTAIITVWAEYNRIGT